MDIKLFLSIFISFWSKTFFEDWEYSAWKRIGIGIKHQNPDKKMYADDTDTIL